eukprot:m.87502 g.87502  ORF g.87502 m.87502 type:complete len:974 (-) comp14910_c1_seq2:66-2987(-)
MSDDVAAELVTSGEPALAGATNDDEFAGFGTAEPGPDEGANPKLRFKGRASTVWTEMKEVKVDPISARRATHLYPVGDAEATARLASGRMSTGEQVDAVLTYVIPDDETEYKANLSKVHLPENEDEDTSLLEDMKERHYFETELTKARLARVLASNEAELASGSLSAEAAEKVEQQVRLQKHYLEFGALKLEHEVGSDGKEVFVKIHAPIKTLCAKAEAMELVMPLLPTVTTYAEKRESMLMSAARNTIGIFFRFREWYMSTAQDDEEEDEFFSAAFKFSEIEKFRNGDKPENWEKIFSPAQRTMLVHHILEDTRYSQQHPDMSNAHQIGVSRLVKKKTYTGAYALHDGRYKRGGKESEGPDGERCQLYESWAKWGNWWKPQPLERVRKYFGEKVAYYFAFLGFYTTMLAIPGLIGLFIFIYGLGTYEDQQDAKDVCSSNLVMCGICSTCDKWDLSAVCTTYKLGYVFDNAATVFFALFMAFWGTFLFEFWLRRQNQLAYDWDVMSFHETEPQRPQFRSKSLRPHPVTGRLQRHESKTVRIRRYFASIGTIVLMLALVIMSVIGIIVFRLAVQAALFEKTSGAVQRSSGAITSILAALLSLVMIIFWTQVYTRIAHTLTDWENHETQSSYDHQLSLKMFLFQFVNFYSTLFYIAFFKGQFTGIPGDYNKLFGLRQDDCPEYGCLFELTIQLAIIMVGKQTINNFQELVLPAVMSFFKRRGALKEAQDAENEHKEFSPWESQSHLVPYPAMGQFTEYLELVVQFGFVTLFVAAFPLAPLFAFLNNVLEVRVDSKKLVRNMQRPFANRAEGIGIWLPVLRIIGLLAVVTNGFVIGFTSSFIPKLVYSDKNGGLDGYITTAYPLSPAVTGNANEIACHYRGFRDGNGDKTILHFEIMMARLAFVLVFEHFVFFVKFLVAYVIPDVPQSIVLEIKREEYQAKIAFEKALYGDADGDAELDVRVVHDIALRDAAAAKS